MHQTQPLLQMSSQNAAHSRLCRGDDDADVAQSFEVLFDLLRSPVRARILYELADEDGPVPVAELAARVQSTTNLSRDALEVELRHTHLPKLDSEGIVDFADEVDTVTPASYGPRLQFLIEYVAQEEGWNGTPLP